MRAAFILSDVLQADPDAAVTLASLKEGGIVPVVLAPHPEQEHRLDLHGYPVVTCRPDDPDCWGEEPTLVLDASRRAGATPSEAFMVCHDVADLTRAAEAGCRPVLVMAGRTLDEIYGPGEPECKASICAPSLSAAAEYMQIEADLQEELGPFPYAHVSTLDERARAGAPSRRDLTRVMIATIIAGIAVALGIAYILQEFYQIAAFPRQFYWLTLQFIPQFLRGGLVLGIGVLIAIFTLMSLDRRPRRAG
jgi:hypothetical protein